MDDALQNAAGQDGTEDSNVETDAAPRALRPEFRDPENWHDLAERGTPRNG